MIADVSFAFQVATFHKTIFFSPLFLLGLKRLRLRYGIGLICCTIGISTLVRMYLIQAHNYPATSMVFVQPEGYNPDVVGHYFQVSWIRSFRPSEVDERKAQFHAQMFHLYTFVGYGVSV